MPSRKPSSAVTWMSSAVTRILPSTPARLKFSVLPDHELSMSNFSRMAAAVSLTAAFARLSECGCLRWISMLGMSGFLERVVGEPLTPAAAACYDAANAAAQVSCTSMHIPRVRGGRGEWVRAIVSLLLAWVSIGAFAAEISGHIDLTSDGKDLRPEEAQDAVIYFRPKQAPKIKPAAKPYVMGTRHKQFVPRVLPIALGSQVQFPNQDPILHNAFSTSKDNPFDVGLYGEGEGQTLTFTHVGYVRVYCNVHHSMIGHLLVLDTPYFTQPDA